MSQGSISSGSQALRPRDVCQQLGIQPYVLKFWEGEFPQLGRRLGAKRLYGAEELKILAEIQRLVEGERLNLGQAREELARAFPEGEQPRSEPAPENRAPEAPGNLLGEARETIRQLSEQVGVLQARLAEKTSEMDGLRHRHQQVAESAAAMREERDTLLGRVSQLEASAASEERRAQRLEEELKEALTVQAALQARLTALQEGQAAERRRFVEQLRTALQEVRALGQALDQVRERLT